jgi:hypothetical protein
MPFKILHALRLHNLKEVVSLQLFFLFNCFTIIYWYMNWLGCIGCLCIGLLNWYRTVLLLRYLLLWMRLLIGKRLVSLLLRCMATVLLIGNHQRLNIFLSHSHCSRDYMLIFLNKYSFNVRILFLLQKLII